MSELLDLAPQLREACKTEEFYALLDEWGCGASNGGCLVTAVALKKVMGRGGLWGLYGKYKAVDLEYGNSMFHHVTLKVGNLYLDGEGVWDKEAIVKYWNGFGLFNITGVMALPAKPADMNSWGLLYDAEIARNLTKYFKAKLSIPSLTP